MDLEPIVSGSTLYAAGGILRLELAYIDRGKMYLQIFVETKPRRSQSHIRYISHEELISILPNLESMNI
jgi:hypothetical protein